jgi:hypothetical protein
MNDPQAKTSHKELMHDSNIQVLSLSYFDAQNIAQYYTSYAQLGYDQMEKMSLAFPMLFVDGRELPCTFLDRRERHRYFGGCEQCQYDQMQRDSISPAFLVLGNDSRERHGMFFDRKEYHQCSGD